MMDLGLCARRQDQCRVLVHDLDSKVAARTVDRVS